MQYSSFATEFSGEFCPLISREEFYARLTHKPTDEICAGATDAEIDAQQEALFAELDALCFDGEPTPPAQVPADPAPVDFQTALADDTPTWELIIEPVRRTAYDRAFVALREAEAERDAAAPDSPEYHCAMANVAEAKARFEIEKHRDQDEGFRELRRIDEYRAGEGREERNAGRRAVRAVPNKRLSEMSAEDRARHEKGQAADKKWANRMRYAGWTEERIKAGLAHRRAKRTAAQIPG